MKLENVLKKTKGSDHLKQFMSFVKSLFFKTLSNKTCFLRFILAIAALIIGVGCNILVPILFKNIVESFSLSSETSFTLVLISYGAIWTIAQASINIREVLIAGVRQQFSFEIGATVLKHLYSLSLKFHVSQKTGTITNVIQRAQNNVPTIVWGLIFFIIPILIEVSAVITILIFNYPLLYSFILAGTLSLFSLFTIAFTRKALDARYKANTIDKNVDANIIDWLFNYELIRSFGQTKSAVRRSEALLYERKVAETNFVIQYNFVRLGQILILGTGLSLMTTLIGSAVLEKELSQGDFVLFNGYMIQFMSPISLLGMVFRDVRKAVLDLKDILDILATPIEVMESPNNVILKDDAYTIEFKDVSFRYGKNSLLEKLSFKISPGQRTIILGPSGSGKSTISKLILRLFEVDKGQILINGTDIRDISFDSLYKVVSNVPQQSSLFNDTIKFNIGFANEEASFEDIKIAAEEAEISTYIEGLPDQYDTLVGERGVKLSGGEKQRISIARMFLKKPKICIFDEPTSSLDIITQRKIESRFKNISTNQSSLIISHQLSVIRETDQIIILNNGKIVQSGLHEELISEPGLYKEMRFGN